MRIAHSLDAPSLLVSTQENYAFDADKVYTPRNIDTTLPTRVFPQRKILGNTPEQLKKTAQTNGI